MSRRRPRNIAGQRRTSSSSTPPAPMAQPPVGSSVEQRRPAKRSKIVWYSCLIIILGLVLTIAFWMATKPRKVANGTNESTRSSVLPALEKLTFSRDIAPIVFQKCAGCHRPGQSAPFGLLTFQQVKRHAREIAEVTDRRYMPPWLPEPGYGEFVHDRSLTTNQLEVIQRWIAEGAIEGNPADVPLLPHFPEGWQLGVPDLVVTLPQAYTLSAEGKDVYRNFVVPIPVPANRYVKGVEFLPGNPRVIHHAFIDVDETRQSRILAERQDPPGFGGMDLPESAVMPGGQFLGWQPGKAPYFSSPGLSWLLRTNTDMVLQLHMHPSGKPEVVLPSVGFFFTDQAPTNTPFRIALKCFELDIPAGADRYTVEQSYELPVDLNILRVSTHAHYLAKEMQGYAILPGGEKKWLIWIRNWDFNWQGDYEYAEPQFLPKGSRVVMQYSYDNSTNNVHNPNQPPKRVRFGLETTDEMGELWLQALPRSPQERDVLARDYFTYLIRATIAYDNFRLRLDAENVAAHTRLGRSMHLMGKLSDAMSHLSSAVRIKPDDDQAHYELALLYLTLGKLQEAQQEFLTVIRLNPNDFQAHGNLGGLYLRAGRKDDARACFETALRLNPEDPVARRFLDGLLPGQQ